MEKTTLSKIEESINQLSLDEQLWLIERLAQSIHNYMLKKTNTESQLTAMANDPENLLSQLGTEVLVEHRKRKTKRLDPDTL